MRSHRKSRNFFRIILSDNQSSLEIPKRFTREHRKQILLNNVRLIVDDKVWPLGWMISDDGKLWLQRGWPEFIEHYCIEVGYLLLFNYLGKSVFHVSIFDRSCGEINYLTPSKSPKSWKRKDRSVIQEMEGTRKSGRVAINTSLSRFKNTLDHPVGIDDDDDFTNPIAGMNMPNKRKANKQSIEGTRKSGRVAINTSLSRVKNTLDDLVGVDDDDDDDFTNPIVGMNMPNTRKANKQSIEGTRKSGRVAINTSFSRFKNTADDPIGVDDDEDFTNPIVGINMPSTQKANKESIEGTRKSERVAINTSLSRFKNTPDDPIGVDDDEDFTNPIAGINIPNTRKANKESIEGTRKSERVAINTSLSLFKNTPDDPIGVDDDEDFTNPIVGINMPNTRKANKESIEGTKKKEQVKKRKVVKKQKMVVVDDEDDTFQNPSSRSTLRIDAQTLDQTEERTQMVVSTEEMDEAANNESVKTHETMHSEEVLENMEEIEVITQKGRKRKAVEKGENKSQKKTKRKYYSILTRTSPKTLYRAIRTLSPKQHAKVIEMGFGSLLKMKLDGIPSRLGYFVVDKYNPVGCELRTDKGHIEITKETIHDMIGAPIGGISLESLPTTESGLAIARRWREQFPKKDIRPGDVLIQMTKSKDVDINFMLNFMVIFCNTMAKVKGNGFCDIEFVPKINEAIDVANIDWCAYIFESLISCKNTWKGKGADSYFCGALTTLTLHYVDSVRCKGFEVKRQRPAIQGWSVELLKVREEAEIENGGFGLGDFYPPYQEDEDEDETQTIEGMVEKLEGILQNHLELKESSDMILSRAYEKYPDCPDFKLWEQKVRMILCEKDDNVAEGISEGSDVQDQTMDEGVGM